MGSPEELSSSEERLSSQSSYCSPVLFWRRQKDSNYSMIFLLVVNIFGSYCAYILRGVILVRLRRLRSLSVKAQCR